MSSIPQNVGTTPVRFLPSTFGCAAWGHDGAIPVTKLILTPVKGGEPLSIVYRSHNHLSDECLSGKGSHWSHSLEASHFHLVSGRSKTLKDFKATSELAMPSRLQKRRNR